MEHLRESKEEESLEVHKNVVLSGPNLPSRGENLSLTFLLLSVYVLSFSNPGVESVGISSGMVGTIEYAPDKFNS
jgi:hypothetical protein